MTKKAKKVKVSGDQYIFAAEIEKDDPESVPALLFTDEDTNDFQNFLPPDREKARWQAFPLFHSFLTLFSLFPVVHSGLLPRRQTKPRSQITCIAKKVSQKNGMTGSPWFPLYAFDICSLRPFCQHRIRGNF